MNEKFNEFIREYESESTRNIHKTRIKRFCEISEISLELLTDLSAQECRKLIIETRDRMKEHGKSSNTILGYISSVRSYFEFLDKPVKIKRSALPKAEMASGFHVFSNGDLATMFDHADIRMKAFLAVACSTGYEISAIENMDRQHTKAIIQKAIADKQQFVFRVDTRRKTGETRLTVFNPLCIEWLNKWLKSSEKKNYDTVFGIKNDMFRLELEKLARNSDIKLEGKVRTHNLRKWLMSSLDKAGFTEFQTKYILGKSIGKSDMTYLTSLKNVISEKYPKVYNEHLNILGQQQKKQEITQMTAQELVKAFQTLTRDQFSLELRSHRVNKGNTS